MMNYMGNLFRGRPYTRAVPFAFTSSGTAGAQYPLWNVQNGAFEWGEILIRAAATATDFNVCDTTVDNICGMVVAETARYGVLSLDGLTWRSNSTSNANILLVDVNGVADTYKGILYMYEVTREGMYR
jgi:hypothetical protein